MDLRYINLQKNSQLIFYCRRTNYKIVQINPRDGVGNDSTPPVNLKLYRSFADMLLFYRIGIMILSNFF